MQTQCDVLDQAIDTERKGIQFYTEAAAKASSARSRDLLLNLADDERYHERVLAEQRQAIEQTGVCAIPAGESSLDRSKGALRPSVIPTDRRRALAIAKAGVNELEALKVGMKAEESSYHFYSQAAGREDVQELKALYQSLAAWEKGHFEVLQEMHDFLHDPEEWYVRQEHPIFEG